RDRNVTGVQTCALPILPLGLSSMVSKLNRYADKFIVSIILPAAAYAEYSIGAQEVPIIRVIPFAVGTVLISRYVSLELESKKERSEERRVGEDGELQWG